MKTIKFIPSQARGEGAIFEGHVEFFPLGLDEKLDFMSDIGIDTEEKDGETKVKMGGRGNMAFMSALIRLSKTKYSSVDIKLKATGEEFKSYDDLNGDPDCHEILKEVALALMNGTKAGNG